MPGNEEKIFKLRLKLKSGEEFEAEGNLAFIEKQKEAFFKLSESALNQNNGEALSCEQKTIPQHSYINQTYKASINYNPAEDISNLQQNIGQEANINEGEQTFRNIDTALGKQTLPSERTGDIIQEGQNNAPLKPRFSPKTDIWGKPIKQNLSERLYTAERENPSNKYTPAYFSKVKTKSPAKQNKNTDQPIPRPEGSVWERIAYPDGRLIILRRKDKTLSTELAALIILGAAKMLNNMPKMSALELSKSLKVSGYLKDKERLDRILAQEIKQSTLVFEGSKRNRDYILTQSGTAKAYTAAERVLLNG